MKTTVLLLIALLPSPAVRAAEIAAAPVAYPAGIPAPAAPLKNGPINFSLNPVQVVVSYAQAQTDFTMAVQRIATIPAEQRTFANTIKAFEEAGAVYSDRIQHLMFLKHVSPEERLRNGADMVEDDASKYGIALMQNDLLYQAIVGYAEKKEKLSDEDQRLLDATVRGFKLAGMGLSEEKRAELKKMQERLSDLQNEFETNIANSKNHIIVTAEDLQGMPEDYIKGLDKTADGKFIINANRYPDVIPFMQYSPRGDLRKAVNDQFNNRAAPRNIALLEEALRLRRDSAKLLGYEGYPQQALDGRMAETPEKVMKFLNDLWPIARQRGEAELNELLALKRQDDPAAERIEGWDTKYYSEKLRQQRYAVDEQKLAEYFPVDKVVSGTLKVYERAFGVKFTEVKNPEVWHPDVRLFKITDPKTDALIAYFYLDLYPRLNKYTHAAAFGLVSGRLLGDGKYNPPIASMVANFTKPVGDKPALLKPDEVSTFFHEFGHLMHGTLTKARYASFAGTSVARDFVEAPSQMLEHFVWDREVINEISGHYLRPDEKMPEELRQKVLAASAGFEDSGLPTGIHYLRQLAFAIADMTIHSAVPSGLNELFNQLLSLISLVPQPEDTAMVASFGHLMGGYGAGYYGYLWSKVYGDDMFTRFIKEGIFSIAGADYRHEILESGSGRPEIESLRRFLKREPSMDAFLERLKSHPALTPPASPAGPGFLDAARAAGLATPLTSLDDPRLNDPRRLEAQGWTVEGAPEADVVHYRFTGAGGFVQEYTADIRGDRSFGMIVTRWQDGAVQRKTTISRGGDGKTTQSSTETTSV